MSEITEVASPNPENVKYVPEDVRDRFLTVAIDMPVMFEDEGQEEMGETDIHTKTTGTLFWGIKAHLADRQEVQVFSDLNCYYHPIKRWAYFSADVMVVAPNSPLVELATTSYRISENCPAPLLVIEVLSRRSFQQQDLTNKPEMYADLHIAEYILADPTGQFLPERLLRKRLLSDCTWKDEQDADGGITSRLGFRVRIEDDGHVRVINAKTGAHYARPEEAQMFADQTRATKERIRALEEELAQLRGTKPPAKKGKGRKPKS
jgi:hypothetical protein